MSIHRPSMNLSVGCLTQCLGTPYVNEIWTMSNDNDQLKRLIADSPETCILSASPDSSLEVCRRTQELSQLMLTAYLEASAPSLQYQLGVYFYCCSVQLAVRAKLELKDSLDTAEDVSHNCNRSKSLLSSFHRGSPRQSCMAAYCGPCVPTYEMQVVHCTVMLDRGATWMMSCHSTLQWLIGNEKHGLN